MKSIFSTLRWPGCNNPTHVLTDTSGDPCSVVSIDPLCISYLVYFKYNNVYHPHCCPCPHYLHPTLRLSGHIDLSSTDQFGGWFIPHAVLSFFRHSLF